MPYLRIIYTYYNYIFHLFQFKLTLFASLSNRLPHSLFPVLHSFLTPLASFSSVPFTCLIVMKPVSHHDEISVSSRWNLCLFTMKLTLYACINDAQHVRKEGGIGEKECWNRWKTIRKQVRKLGKPVKLIGYNLRLSPISVGYIIG